MWANIYPTITIAGSLAALICTAAQAQSQGSDGSSALDRKPADIAPIFPQPGILTPGGHFVVEPAIQFSHASSTKSAIVGFNVIPVLPNFIEAREVRRNSTAASLTIRHGVTNRLELEIKIPYAYRSDTLTGNAPAVGIIEDRIFENSGAHLGDAELGARYQFNEGGIGHLYFIGGLRYKSRTGRDPFEVVSDCETRCVAGANGRTGLPLDLPTGSGFHAVESSLTWLLPSDRAILFGTFSYTHHFKRSNVSRNVLNGEQEQLGEIRPGAAIGVNVGLGLALDERSAVSFGYEHNSIARMRHNGQRMPGSVRTQLGTAMVGFSYRIDRIRSLNVSLGAGLTRDAPDVSVMLRLPMTF